MINITGVCQDFAIPQKCHYFVCLLYMILPRKNFLLPITDCSFNIHNYVLLSLMHMHSIKHLLEKAETNIQNYDAFDINSGQHQRRSPLTIS